MISICLPASRRERMMTTEPHYGRWISFPPEKVTIYQMFQSNLDSKPWAKTECIFLTWSDEDNGSWYSAMPSSGPDARVSDTPDFGGPSKLTPLESGSTGWSEGVVEGLLFSLLPIREAQVLMLAILGLVMETVIQNLFSGRNIVIFSWPVSISIQSRSSLALGWRLLAPCRWNIESRVVDVGDRWLTLLCFLHELLGRLVLFQGFLQTYYPLNRVMREPETWIWF